MTNAGKDYKVKGIDTVLAAHLAPIPLPFVHIGLGLSFASTTWDKDDIGSLAGATGYSASEARGLDVGIETMVALSIPFLATPYIKAGYSVMDTQAISLSNDSPETGYPSKLVLAETGSGYTIGGGVKFSILPFISAMLEMSMYNGKLDMDSLKGDGVKITPADASTDYTSTSYLAGIEVDLGL
jgi:hypothetical protein